MAVQRYGGYRRTAANLASDTGLTADAVTGVTYTAGGVEGNYARFSNGSIDIYSADLQLSNKLFTEGRPASSRLRLFAIQGINN